MVCFFPIDAWYNQHVNPSGKRGISFKPSPGQLWPKPELRVPCMNCEGCYADASRMWSVRMYHESKLHERSCFITLTYGDDKLPEDGMVNKKHMQDFIKRLRKHSKETLRYFACGEYGEETRRPHYHAIIFGEDFIGGAYRYNPDDPSGMHYNPVLERIWGQGIATVCPVNYSVCSYTAGYVAKKYGNKDEGFHLMSKNLGEGWLDDYYEQLQRTGIVVIEGNEVPIPKQYFRMKPEELAAVKADRKNKVRNRTKSQLASKRINHLAKAKLKNKKGTEV